MSEKAEALEAVLKALKAVYDQGYCMNIKCRATDEVCWEKYGSNYSRHCVLCKLWQEWSLFEDVIGRDKKALVRALRP